MNVPSRLINTLRVEGAGQPRRGPDHRAL